MAVLVEAVLVLARRNRLDAIYPAEAQLPLRWMRNRREPSREARRPAGSHVAIGGRDDCAAEKPATRTLTNLYNERPTWLDLAHKRLDEAVFAAYGWPADLTDDDLLARLLALNLERAGQRPAEPAAADPDASDAPPVRSRRKKK